MNFPSRPRHDICKRVETMYLKIQYRFAVYRVALALGFGGALGRPGAWVFHLPSGPCACTQLLLKLLKLYGKPRPPSSFYSLRSRAAASGLGVAQSATPTIPFVQASTSRVPASSSNFLRVPRGPNFDEGPIFMISTPSSKTGQLNISEVMIKRPVRELKGASRKQIRKHSKNQGTVQRSAAKLHS